MQSQQAALPSLDKSHERLSPKASAYYRLFKQLVGLFDSLPLHILRDQNNELLVNTFPEIKQSLEQVQSQ